MARRKVRTGPGVLPGAARLQAPVNRQSIGYQGVNEAGEHVYTPSDGGGDWRRRGQRFDRPTQTELPPNVTLRGMPSTAPAHALEYAQRNPMSEHASVSGEFAPGRRLWSRLEGEPLDIPGHMHTGVATWDQYSDADKARIEAHARSIGLDPDTIRRNTGHLLDQATQRAQAQPGVTDLRHAAPLGRDWYYEEGGHAQRAAEHEGVSSAKMIGATAAMSPTVQWESATGNKVNLNLARKAARLTEDNPTITITRAHADHLNAAQQDPRSHLGRNPVDWDALVGTHHVNDLSTHVLSTLGSFSGRAGHVKEMDPETGEKIKTPTRTFASHGIQPFKQLSFMAEARGRPNVAKALDVLRGDKSTGEAMSGYGTPKPRTFNDNLSAPYASPRRATIDRWAIRGAAGITPTGRGRGGGPSYTGADDASVMNRMKVAKGTAAPTIAGPADETTGRKTRVPNPMAGVTPASERAQQQGIYAYIQHHVADVANARGYHAQEAQAIAWTQLKGATEGFRQFGTALPGERDFAKQEAARTGTADEPVGQDRVRAEAADAAINRNRRRNQRGMRPDAGSDPTLDWIHAHRSDLTGGR